MNRIKKILIILIAVSLFSSSFGSAAFAAETVTTQSNAIQDTTEDKEATEADNTIESSNTDNNTMEQNVLLSADTGAFEQGSESGQAQKAIDQEAVNAIVEKFTADLKYVAVNSFKTVAAGNRKEETKLKKAAGKTKANKPAYTKAELRLLSCLVYAEAGNQSYSGMLGVANVVLNRLKSDKFRYLDSIKEVIYDRKYSIQFSVTIKSRRTGLSPFDRALRFYDTGKYYGRDTKIEKAAMAKAVKAAKAALNGKNNIGSYLCFSNKSCSRYVKRHFKKYRVIKDQIFFYWEY